MKSSVIPSVRVSPEFRAQLEQVLREDESLSAFVEAAVRDSVQQRLNQADFVQRGMASLAEAQQDLDRLFDFVLERELALGVGDLQGAQAALEAITEGLQLLRRFPFTCRKVGASPFLRELVIPFGHAGYVALFEIVDQTTVVVAAVRHQRESDFH